MKRAGLLLALMLLCGTSVAAASSPDPGVGESEPAAASGGCAPMGPPCGYINPLLDLDFPDKPKCGAALGESDPSKCLPMPADGATVTYAGTVRWYWKESEDTIYPPDAQKPIVISFSSTPSNPEWMTFSVEPPTYTIGLVELLDQRNTKIDDSVSPPVVYYWFERPISVTFTRSGGPDAAGLETLEDKESILEVYVRAKSTESGTTYNAGFGGEYFRFNATSLAAPVATGAVRASPPAGTLVVAAVGLMALLRRRRA